jgi:hypothetical protein
MRQSYKIKTLSVFASAMHLLLNADLSAEKFAGVILASTSDYGPRRGLFSLLAVSPTDTARRLMQISPSGCVVAPERPDTVRVLRELR